MIVVTGASRGIGRAVADRLTNEGIEVLGVARTLFPANFEVRSLSVSSDSATKELCRSLRLRNCKVTGLINCAGLASMNLALMTTPRVVREIIETNLLGTIFMCQALAPLMVRGGGGSIINFSTVAVALALKGESVYVASKGGVEAFSRSFAREVAGHNIRVNCVAPGPIETDLLRGIPDETIQQVVNMQILQSQFETADICDVIQMLLSPLSRSITGQVIHIGGV